MRARCSSAGRVVTSSFSHWLSWRFSSSISRRLRARWTARPRSASSIGFVWESLAPPRLAQRAAGRVVDGGEHEDRQLRLDLERGGHEVHAARAGHADVAQHEGDAMALELLQ